MEVFIIMHIIYRYQTVTRNHILLSKNVPKLAYIQQSSFRINVRGILEISAPDNGGARVLKVGGGQQPVTPKSG